MRKLLLVLFLVYSVFYALPCAAETPTNELPMYGNVPATEYQQALNDRLISDAIQEAGSREEATRRAIKLAWQYFYNNDAETAMKRFNQAWLLDQNNAEVFYGFGHLMSVQGKTDEAILLFKKALEIDPAHSMALANLARSYKDTAYALYIEKRIDAPDDEVKGMVNDALALYEKAIQSATSGSDVRMTDLDSDLRYIYYQWAIALELTADYAGAWEKITLSRKYGGDRLIEPGFIQELSRFMPEPEEKAGEK